MGRTIQVIAGGGGGSAGFPRFPTLANAPDLDPSAIVTASTGGAGLLEVTVDDTILCQTPGNAARWFAPLTDYNGVDFAAIIGDIVSAFLWTTAVHTGKVVWIGVRNSTTNSGMAWGLYANGASWRAIRSVSADGVTWTNTAATADSVNTIGVQGSLGANTAAQVSHAAIPLDINGAVMAGISRGTGAPVGPFDQVFVGVGNYATGGGVGPITLGASVVAHDVGGELTNPLP